MLHPTFNELSQNKFNRYQLAIAAAKCARAVTDEYTKQREAAEKAQTGNKESDKPINTMIDPELKDEKAVKLAVDRIYRGEYVIVEEVPETPVALEAASEEPAIIDDTKPAESTEQEADEGEDA